MAEEIIACGVSWAPLRKEKNSTSEMISSLLYGESAVILERSEDWLYVETVFDHYKGWINIHQTASKLNPTRYFVKLPWIFVIHQGVPMWFPMGSEITENEAASFETSVYDSLIDKNNKSITPWHLTATLLMNTTYLWGGRSAFGIDCSGLVQLIYKIQGINLPRDAWQQAVALPQVLLSETAPGDLAFFSNNEDKITHVGIILDDNRIIHSSGKVRIDSLTPEGIFNQQLQLITHKFHSAGKIV